MEFCSGGDLSNFIRSRRTIPEKYVRRFLQQIGKLKEMKFSRNF
jgi:serine/threonine protein kinase